MSRVVKIIRTHKAKLKNGDEYLLVEVTLDHGGTAFIFNGGLGKEYISPHDKPMFHVSWPKKA